MSNKNGAIGVAPLQTNKLMADILAAKRQLSLLGYGANDPIYWRVFEGKGLKAYPGTFTATPATLPTTQDPNVGVYFVVNGGGHTDKDVTHGRALFVEWDDISQEDQAAKLASCGLPAPTFTVRTRKSLHAYWTFDKPENLMEWQTLQLDAIAWLNSDPAIDNASRVMRFAGYWHVKAGADPIQCTLEAGSGQDYSFTEIRAIVPRQPGSVLKAMEKILEYKPEKTLGNSKGQAPGATLPKTQPRPVDGSRQLSDILEADILPRLGPEDIFNWPGHHFQWTGTDKARGCCPWHESASGTAFHIEPNGSGGQWRWHCPSCNNHGGTAIQYRYRLAGGSGTPTGKDFVEIVGQLAAEAGVELPKAPAKAKAKAKDLREDEAEIPPEDPDVIWRVPKPHNGELGWWKTERVPVMERDPETGEMKQAKNEKGKKLVQKVLRFYPQTNFDFEIEAELSSPDGEGLAGLVLEVKRSLDAKPKRVVIMSLEKIRLMDFTTAITRAYGHDIVCNLAISEVNAAIHLKLAAYRQAGGRVFKLADRVGCQADGYWVFPNIQFTPAGQVCTEEDSGWVYNNSLTAGEDRVPAPAIAPPDHAALKRLVDAVTAFCGPESTDPAMFAIGFVVAGLFYTQIQAREGRFPILNLTGDPGSLKTLVAEAALSLVGNHQNLISRSSESAIYERLKRSGNITQCYDDPHRSKDLDELFKRLYNGEARVLRKVFQEPHAAILATSNHALGDDQPATKSRLVTIPFFPTASANGDAWDDLKAAMEGASGALPQLLSLGYPAEAVRLEAKALRPHLPTAHARVADSLGLILWYAKAVARLTGYPEARLDEYAIATLCQTANEAETNRSSLQDFLEKLGALQANTKIGAWNIRAVEGKDRSENIAIYMPSVWPELDKEFKPSYSRSIIQAAITKAGGVAGGVQRFYRTKDETIAYQRALLAPPGEGGVVSQPEPVPRKCVLLPATLAPELYQAILHPPGSEPENEAVTSLLPVLPPVTSLLPEKGNSQNPNAAPVVASSTPPVTYFSKNRELEREKDQVIEGISEKNSDPIAVIHSEQKQVTDYPGGTSNPSAAPVTAVTSHQVTSGNKQVTEAEKGNREGNEALLPVTRPVGNEKFLGNNGHGNGAEMLPKIDPDTIEWEEVAGHE